VGVKGDGTNVVLPLVQLASQTIQRLTLTPSGLGTTFTGAVQEVARGLRNAAGLVLSAAGDLLLHDNGIDTPDNLNVSLSADELNRIRATDLGQVIPDFGFPGTYVSAADGATVVNGIEVCPTICATFGVTPPLLVYRPIGGQRSEGAVELAIAPSGFGLAFKDGVFSSFFGMFSGGSANEENPVVFADPLTGNYFHFIPNRLLGHPNGLLATADSLFLTDLDYSGSLRNNTGGVIYQIQALPAEAVDVPLPLPMAGVGAGFLWSRRLRHRVLQARRGSGKG
jgi:hypothetical protein